MIKHLVEILSKTEDFESFKRFVLSLKDINQYLEENEENDRNNYLNPLHVCVAYEESEFSLKCIQYLLHFSSLKINFLAKIEGILKTSLHIAIDWKRHKNLDLLIESGIDLFICDSYGLLPLDYALQKEDKSSENIIRRGIDNYLSNKLDSFLILNDIKSKSIYDLTQRETVFHSNKTKDFEETINYFDENKNIYDKIIDKTSENSLGSVNGSVDTIVSNISYEKTESVKSFCSDKTEIYVYNDRDNNVVLIEERFEGFSNNSSNGSDDSGVGVVSKGCATDSQIKEIEGLNGTQIFDELRARGDSPGPVITSTKKYYAKRLLNLRRGTPSPTKKERFLPNYSLELNSLFENRFPLTEVLELEKQFIEFFEKKKCRQHYFIYLLIDPNISDNIPLKAKDNNMVIDSIQQINKSLFKKFIESIFYVGKGAGNRVYEHFYEAIKTNDTQKVSPKVKQIHDIWSSNKGVTSLHCFHDITSKEALSREAAIIESLCLQNLTNKVRGHFVRELKWTERKRKLFGSYLLFKSFGIHVLTGERQIRRPDK